MKANSAYLKRKVTNSARGSIVFGFNAERRYLLLITILFLLVTTYLAQVLNIWFDEAYTLNTTDRPLGDAIRQAIGFEEQAPLYFAVLSLWRNVNGSIFFARLFSVLAMGAVVYLSSGLSKRYLPELHPLILPVLIAVNPISFWAALEIRLYACSILLSAGLMWFFYEAYLCRGIDNKRGRQSRWMYTFLACISLYTHYFLGAILVANSLILLVFRKNNVWHRYIFHSGLIVLLSLPLGWIVFCQLSDLADNTTTLSVTVDSSSTAALMTGVQKSLGSFFLYGLPAPTPQSWAVVRLAAFLSLLGLAFANRRYLCSQIASVWVMLAVLLAQFSVVFWAVDHLHYRHATPMFIASLLGVLGLCIVGSHRGQPVLRLYVVAYLAISLTCLGLAYQPLAKLGDHRRVANYLMANESADQPIVVYNQEFDEALGYYYKGQNLLVPLPKALDFKRFSVDDFMLTEASQIETAIANAEGKANELWLVLDAGVLRQQDIFRPSFKLLDDYFRVHYGVVGHKDFYGAEVFKLKRKIL